jgi:hypothetical protein
MNTTAWVNGCAAQLTVTGRAPPPVMAAEQLAQCVTTPATPISSLRLDREPNEISYQATIGRSYGQLAAVLCRVISWDGRAMLLRILEASSHV